MKKRLFLLLGFLFLILFSNSLKIEARCFEDVNAARDSIVPCEGGGSGGRGYQSPLPTMDPVYPEMIKPRSLTK